MFYVNDEPEGKCLHTDTIKLYFVVDNATHVLTCLSKETSRIQHRNEGGKILPAMEVYKFSHNYYVLRPA